MANSKSDNFHSAYNALGFTAGSLADKAMALLRSKGGTGSLADMQRQKASDGRVFDIVDPARIP